MTIENWVSSIAEVIIALGIVFAVLQVIFLKNQLSLLKQQLILSNEQVKSDHERSRREKAITIMKEWEEQIDFRIAAADKLVSTFTEEQCRDLYLLVPIKIPIKHMSLVLVCLEGVNPSPALEQKDGFMLLSERELAPIRYLIVKYLNLLEIALSSWQEAIVDRETIENQFQFVYKPTEGYGAQRIFRIAMGGVQCYPSIELFIEHLKKQGKGLRLKEPVA